MSLPQPPGGVEVGESIIQSSDSQWKRIYRIRLMFEDPIKIKKTFGVTFSTIKKTCSSGLFYSKLAYLIQLGWFLSQSLLCFVCVPMRTYIYCGF